MKNAFIVFWVMLGIVVSAEVHATTAYMETKVAKTMTANGEFGDCMFKPSSSASERGVDCRDAWLTLDCAGLLGGSKSSAVAMFNEIQLARITGKSVSVRIDDQRKINGWCYVDRIQTLPY